MKGRLSRSEMREGQNVLALRADAGLMATLGGSFSLPRPDSDFACLPPS